MTAELEITDGMVFITDEGHGWLRIPHDIYKLSGYKASKFSYKDDDYVYLEEDADAYGWFKALTGKEWEEFPQIGREIHVTRRSDSNPRNKTRMSGEGFVSPFTKEVAVNSHDALVEACKNVEEAWAGAGDMSTAVDSVLLALAQEVRA